MKSLHVLAALALVLVGCEDTDATQEAEATTTTERPNTVRDEAARVAATAPSTTRATLPPTTTRPADYALGSTLTVTPGDHKITVYTYRSPVTSDNRFVQPKAGNVFAAIEVQQCAGPSGDRFGPNRFDWELAMPDNTRLEPGLSSVVEPQLGSSPLGPGDCIRGWVSFEVPSGATPRHVVYNEVTTGAAKWRVA